MASSGSHRSGLLTAGGALSIAAGVLEVIVGLLFWWPSVCGLEVWGEHIGDLAQPPPPPPMWHLMMIGFVLVALGLFAIIGGVSAIRRKSFGVSLAGAICALPSVTFGVFLAGAISALALLILGIVAVIFVALGKREFGVRA